ncbi:tRNA-splicing endonuclease-like protein [Bimuria novae-zelandiae CBS 107.79]|uniref:tRNA-splicing endonuclease-like protein n=1 Tax=Bimuria novae-zelandiae CBS 107.79 TaxID=1447943 RepID=A0A6A5VKC5_9PLEO|nr:tRNA-splicing endonuclease-like protein [Bimuria novae-zelandiae CBS 107.79]
MAEVVERINELKALPADLHLFCPRTTADDGSVYFLEDLAADPNTDQSSTAVTERNSQIKQAQDRKWIALGALQILAFDGDDAAPHKEWMVERLDRLMTSCDVCVRVFHQSRAEWRQNLLEQYDEEHVHLFLQTVDNQALGRIKRGLDEAHSVLRNADPKQRGVRILPTEATYAIFEALSCDAMIRNEELLQRHFDAPFELVQSKKRLKLQTFVPAMTRFLFSRNERRQIWASMSWSTFKRSILQSEFDWAVRDHLVNAMMKVQMTNLDRPFLPIYWAGVKLIVNKLDKQLITSSLRDLEGNFYRLLLDHLHLDQLGFLDIVETMRTILEISPVDFWDAMNGITTSTTTIVEQVFNSPILKQMLVAAAEDREDAMNNLRQAFSWIPPFLASIKPTNLPPAVRAFANALFRLLQSDKYSPVGRAICFKEGLRVMDFAFRKMCEGKAELNFVGQPTVNSMLEILSTHVELIVSSLKRLHNPETEEDRRLLLSTIQHAFTLEATSLNIEKQLIERKKPSPKETPPSTPLWTAVFRAIDADNVDLATHLLVAGRNLIGLEPLLWKAGYDNMPVEVKHFNGRFKLMAQTIADIVDRMTEFKPKQLDALFRQPASATGIISLLFSSSEDTRSSVIELLKVITGQEERRDALQDILKKHYKLVLVGLSDSCRQVTRKRIFAPASSMVRSLTDIIDVLCNSQDGLLRARQFEPGEEGATMNFWKNLWNTLTMFFATTEAWSNLGVYQKEMMKDFCRDVMQFADYVFDQCSVFASALGPSSPGEEGRSKSSELLTELLQMPAATMAEAKRWLRLRDEYLSSKSVTLIGKLLVRLRTVSIEIDPDTLEFMMDIVLGKVKANLNANQQAELQRAIETHLGHSMVKEEQPKQPRQVSISSYVGGSSSKRPTTDSEARAKLMKAITPTVSAFKENRAFMKVKEAQAAKKAKDDEAKNAAAAEFKRKRQLELERSKKEREAAIAKARKERGITGATAEAGSALAGLGVLDRDSAPKGEGLMHSSDESEDEDEFDVDDELFGIKKPSNVGPRTNITNELVKVPMPVKKRRVQRSAKDMRARLQPDLTPLWKTILGWDYYHDGVYPPKMSKDKFARVVNTFRTVNDYQTTFGGLLTLEAWQGFAKAREESTGKPYSIRITQRSTVDAFMEIGSGMTQKEDQEIQISESDVVLLSTSAKPSAQEPHCLARIHQKKRNRGNIEVLYRVMPGSSNPMSSSLNPNNTIFGTKIQAITPLEREYGSLHALQYYDLCDEIINAKPSPILAYKDSQVDPLMQNYNLNKAQAKAVKSAFDNDAFTLIQGPPGSGKTKTITAIVGAILSDSLRKGNRPTPMPGQSLNATTVKKLLVCAPSNAAVDELVMRFKAGIKTLDGVEHKVSVVRIGRSDAMNENVRDICLDELVNKKLGLSNNDKEAEATQQLFAKHKNVSAHLNQVRQQMDSGEFKGEALEKITQDFHALRREKALLGTRIDNAKDDQKLAYRNKDIEKKREQERVLREAHIVCATLSGSGHDMFQNMSIEFETVIVDEAAQCVEMSALIPLKYSCAKCILVGDPKQLPPTVFSKEAAAFQYEQSLFVRMQKNHPQDVHLLDTQYRMHPEISFYPSWTFYDGRLVDGGDMAALRKQPWHNSYILGPYRFFDVQGQQQSSGHSLINTNEVKIALKLYARLIKDYPTFDFRGKVGIITPYKSQLKYLKDRFIGEYGNDITKDVMFNTTDAFQGREAEIIIFSCVRAAPSGGVGFLQDIRRMNVGLTRAKSSLWVLGNAQSLMRGQFWKKLVEDAQRRDRFTSGNLHSILDKPSDHYMATPGMFDQGVPVPMELESEVARNQPTSNRAPQNFNAFIKQEPANNAYIKQESHNPNAGQESQNVQIKQEPNQNGKRGHDSDGDVGMSDADDGSDTLNGSNASVSHSATPEPMEGVQRQQQQQRLKKKKPRQAPNPLVSRPPKKPRN